MNPKTAYIDKMAVLALMVDRSDEAKARFVSNVTRGQVWAYHEKGRIAPTASYDRVFQAFAASIRDREELESGRGDRGAYSKKGSFRCGELYKNPKATKGVDSNGDSSDDEIFINQALDDQSTKDDIAGILETYFENARFSNHPRTIENTQNKDGRTGKSNTSKNYSSKSIGCFNCGRTGC